MNSNSEGIVYVYAPDRAHELLPLLDQARLQLVRGPLDLLRRPQRPRLVMIDTFGRYGYLGLAASLLWRVPLVIRLRADIFREIEQRVITSRVPGKRQLSRALVTLCWTRAEAVVFNSRYLAERYQSRVRNKHSGVVYIPYTPPPGNDVETDTGGDIRPEVEPALRLLSVTNMDFYDKIGPLLELIRSLPREFWHEDMVWTVCGGGAHAGRFAAAVREAGLSQRVRLPGRVGNVARYYRHCDVFVHFTGLDAFPNVMLEAMYYALPTIVNRDSCGTREQIEDGATGFVVEDTAGFVAAVRRYRDRPELRASHGEAGRRRLTAFGVDAQRVAMKKFLCTAFARSR